MGGNLHVITALEGVSGGVGLETLVRTICGRWARPSGTPTGTGIHTGPDRQPGETAAA